MVFNKIRLLGRVLNTSKNCKWNGILRNNQNLPVTKKEMNHCINKLKKPLKNAFKES